MFTSSEKFTRLQQQFNECTSFEQLCTIVELTRSFQISYQHFLIQLYQINIQKEDNVMFYHTVEDANSPGIVTCLLSNSLDKILFTIQLYLPLISTETFDEKLFHAYRDVLIYLDTNLSPTKFTYSELQLINVAQQIVFYIQMNINLNKLLSYIPKLINLIKTKTFHSDEQQQQQQQQQHRQPLQRFPSIRSQIPSLMTVASEVSSNSQMSQQLTRLETNDSGVDLSETSITNPVLSMYNQKHPFLDRNLSGPQRKHLFVGKTASSPIPEHATLDVPVRLPLTGVLSAPPATTNHSDSRPKNCTYQHQKYVSTLSKSDEEEEDESQKQIHDLTSDKNHSTDSSRPLGQFYSLRYRNIKNSNTEDVSQYLGVDANSAPVISTFTQCNTGMKDVPKWLKHLRLHKYELFFSQLTYDEMMNLTNEQLKASHITEGACTKILINIKKLKERPIVLKQYLIDIDNGQIDLSNLIPQLNELMMTPIRPKQLENQNQNEEDLPKLIVEVLEKMFQQLPLHASPDISHSLLLLVDSCYRHEAFNDYAHLFLQWRRRLSNILQSFGRIDYKSNQSTFFQPRRSLKPSIRSMKSLSSTHSNYSPNSVSLSKYNSEPQNNNFLESNLIRRPTIIYPTTEESNELNHRTIIPQTNQGTYLANNQHQALTRKASIDPYGDTNTNNRTKLCKTFSDPHRMRSQNLSQTNSMQSSNKPQQNIIRMISTPYSQQQKQFISQSPPTSIMDNLGVSPIKKCHSDNERSNYYDNYDDQQQNNTELELMCRQITDNAIGDNVNDSSNQNSNNITDMEQ